MTYNLIQGVDGVFSGVLWILLLSFWSIITPMEGPQKDSSSNLLLLSLFLPLFSTLAEICPWQSSHQHDDFI